MSEAASPRLLAREQHELDAIAESIREGRRMVAFLVCPVELRPAALKRLSVKSRREVPSPVEAETPEKTLRLLSDAADAQAGDVRSIAVDSGHEDAIRALNWHREKLRRGALALIWIPDVEGLRVVRRLAPDAFSYRDTLVALKGDKSVQVVPANVDHFDVRMAQARYDAARFRLEKLQAARSLADALRIRNAMGAALDVLDAALATITPEDLADYTGALAVARLHFHASAALKDEGCRASSFRHAVTGLSILQEHSEPLAVGVRYYLTHMLASPLGMDHRTVLEALERYRAASSGPGEIVLVSAALSHAARGDVPGAARLLKEAKDHPEMIPHNRALIHIEQARLALRTGNLEEVEPHLLRASALRKGAGYGNDDELIVLAERDVLCGELASARRLLEDVFSGQGSALTFDAGLVQCLLQPLRVDTGHVADGLTALRSFQEQTAASGKDEPLYRASVAATDCFIAAHKAERLSPADIETADSALRDAQAAAIAVSGEDPPWYHALYPVLRGRIFALLPDRLSDAIEMTRAALALCERAYTDAAPMTARTLAAHLVKAGRFEEALSTIERATPQIVQERFLEDLARVRALKLVCLVHRHAPSSAIAAVLADLRATFDEMVAPRITADTLLELALLLPEDCRHPDPLSLLEEAHELFADMPIVAKEARCLEAMGDVLCARGDLAPARARHRTARDILERTGLLLRVPLLDKKLAVSNPR